MYASDKIWVTELILIHKNIRSVRNTRASLSQISHRSRWDISDSVYLDLQNWRYFIFNTIINHYYITNI